MSGRVDAPLTPPSDSEDAIVQVYALQAGQLTLPERFFVKPASQTAHRTVPSLAFLILHHNQDSHRITRILLDLGIRRNIDRYPEPIQKHIATRQPLTTDPDVTKSLAAGGLTPDDIDYIIYSHVSCIPRYNGMPLTTSRYTGTTSESLETSREARSSLATVHWTC